MRPSSAEKTQRPMKAISSGNMAPPDVSAGIGAADATSRIVENAATIGPPATAPSHLQIDQIDCPPVRKRHWQEKSAARVLNSAGSTARRTIKKPRMRGFDRRIDALTGR